MQWQPRMPPSEPPLLNFRSFEVSHVDVEMERVELALPSVLSIPSAYISAVAAMDPCSHLAGMWLLIWARQPPTPVHSQVWVAQRESSPFRTRSRRAFLPPCCWRVSAARADKSLVSIVRISVNVSECRLSGANVASTSWGGSWESDVDFKALFQALLRASPETTSSGSYRA